MYKKFIGDGINSEIKNSTCNNVLNIIRALIEDKNCKVYIPNDYKKGTLYTPNHDPKVHFYPVDCGRQVQIVGLQSNQERFNFSALALVDVMVEVEVNGEVELVDKKVWRQFNIIRDGQLTMNYICAVLSEENFDALKKIGILYYNGVEVKPNHKYKAGYVYKIMLDKLPLISYNWANPVTIGLYSYIQAEVDLTYKIKVLKAYKKEHESQLAHLPAYPNDSSNIYSESYSGITKEDREPVTAECIVYSIDGMKPEEFVPREYETIEDLNTDISNYNKELRYVRFIIRCIVYAIESTKNKGSYEWSDAVKSPRSEKYTRTADVHVNDSVIKLVRTNYSKKF